MVKKNFSAMIVVAGLLLLSFVQFTPMLVTASSPNSCVNLLVTSNGTTTISSSSFSGVYAGYTVTETDGGSAIPAGTVVVAVISTTYAIVSNAITTATDISASFCNPFTKPHTMLDSSTCSNILGGSWVSSTCTVSGVDIPPGGTLVISSGTTLLINNEPGNNGLTNHGTIENDGNITISNANPGGVGLVNYGTIENSGRIKVGNTASVSDGLTNVNGGTIKNDGTIIISNGADTTAGLVNDGSTIENTGNITISNTGPFGLQNLGTIKNSGNITINNSNNDGLENGGTIQSTGNITVSNTGGIGVLNQGVIKNSYNITISNSGGVGIVNFDTIKNSGSITISNSGSSISGINNDDGITYNSGTIVVTCSSVGNGFVNVAASNYRGNAVEYETCL